MPPLQALRSLQHVRPVPLSYLLLLLGQGALVVGQVALLLLLPFHLNVGPSSQVLLSDQLPLCLDALHADLVLYPGLLGARLLVELHVLAKAEARLVVELRHGFRAKIGLLLWQCNPVLFLLPHLQKLIELGQKLLPNVVHLVLLDLRLWMLTCSI